MASNIAPKLEIIIDPAGFAVYLTYETQRFGGENEWVKKTFYCTSAAELNALITGIQAGRKFADLERELSFLTMKRQLVGDAQLSDDELRQQWLTMHEVTQCPTKGKGKGGKKPLMTADDLASLDLEDALDALLAQGG